MVERSKCSLKVLPSLLLGIAILFNQGRAEIKIASFQIDQFGDEKWNNVEFPWIQDVIPRIFCQFDVIFVMGITGSYSFLQEVNATLNMKLVNKTNSFTSDCRNENYNFISSKELGDSNCKERYAYFYSPDAVVLSDTHVYSGQNASLFFRPPFVTEVVYPPIETVENPEIYLRPKQYTFRLIGIHTKPEAEANAIELDGLVEVYNQYLEMGCQSAYILGNLNADCEFLSPETFIDLKLTSESNFQWLVGDYTTLEDSKLFCAFDSFISGGEKAHECHIPGSGGVLNFKGLIEEYVTIENQIKYNSHTLQLALSEHYPVFVTIDCERASRKFSTETEDKKEKLLDRTPKF